jgi:AcrR family transcriptional regulator
MEYTGKALDIMDAAKKLFSQKGFKAVTTKEIAKEASVNEVTIFRQFQSKENLFEQVISNMIFEPKISEFINNNEPDLNKYLQNIGNLIHSIFLQNIDLFKIELMERQILKGRKIISKSPNEIKKIFTEYLINIQKFEPETAVKFAIVFMSAVHGLCINIYFLETFEPKPDFNNSLIFLINKMK